MTNLDPIKKFAIQFFTGLGAEVKENEESLFIDKIPLKFEKFYGKKGPYNLVFTKKDSDDSDELLTSESYLLKTMRNYLDNRGGTSLLKMKPGINFLQVLKDNFVLPNSRIVRINTPSKFKNIVRFTFQTTYSYLNKEDRIVNDILVEGNKIVDYDLTKFSFGELKSSSFDFSVKNDYSLAKEQLKGLLLNETEKISRLMEENLDKELKRVNEHFEQQVKELEERIQKFKKRIERQKKEGKKVLENSLNNEIVDCNIEKDKARKEKDFFLENENKKHTLKISNKLLNTTIILCPVYDLEIFLKSEDKTKLVVLKFDPVTGELGKPNCKKCSNPINEWVFCNGCHLVCRQCGERCGDCQGVSCELCLTKKCKVSNRNICNDCGAVCFVCRAFKHKRYMVTEGNLGRYRCEGCKDY